MDVELDRRKREVLSAVVTDYIATAEPVGSRTIARKYGLGVSPATIRNEMSDLVELGYLEQPHTSAGRIPSDAGYRFYVDRIMRASPPEDDTRRVMRLFALRARRVEAVVQRAINVLSETTDCLAMVMGPEAGSVMLHYLQILPLQGGRAVLVLATDEGMIRSRVLEWPEDIPVSEAQRISSVLSRRLRGLTLDQVGRGLIRSLTDELRGYRNLVDHILEMLEAMEEEPGHERVLVSGTTRIFKHPEFHDIERIKSLFHTLEEHELLQELLSMGMDRESVQIIIGRENPRENMQDLSLVMATYLASPLARGRVAVLGPKRMDYERIVGLVELVSDTLNKALRQM